MITDDEKNGLHHLQDIREEEEEDLVRMLAEAKYGIPSINLKGVIIENEALRSIDEQTAHTLEVGPFKLLGKHLHVAVRAPERPEIAPLKKQLEEKGYIPEFYMASKKSLEKVWERYQELSYSANVKAGGLDISADAILEMQNTIHTYTDVAEALSNSQKEQTHHISRMLEIILGGALSINASDIHIEPEEDTVRLRYRLDGVLQDVVFFDEQKFKLLSSRIKLLSGLKLTKGISQDGRFSIYIGETEISIRTSLIPGAYGESIVMRILNPKAIGVKFEELGIEAHLQDILTKEITRPNGLILITGPTGSGKTTTLYAFLKKIYSPEVKIITIEDPIEYHLPGITQTQKDDEKGYSFAEGLRSVLRQDPDVIMVGEIRDSETAKTAVESALTGHLVFSTLHTNNAQGVIPRLIDLGVNPKIIPSALTISMAQRLVRTLCVDCKKERPVNEKELSIFTTILTKAKEEGKDVEQHILKLPTLSVYEPVGCPKCNMLGYKGRIGIYEAILSDAAIEKVVNENPSEREIKKIAQTQGILDMKEDGVIKIMAGLTTLSELESVVAIDEE